MRGTIVKGIAGFYYVKDQKDVYQCKARGVFKKEGITPAVGDQVEFEPGKDEEHDGIIEEILPRSNQFIRPPIANVDCFAIVLAAAHPAPNLVIADKFLVMAEKSHTEIIVCINKIDLLKDDIVDQLKKTYGPLYPVVCVSGSTGIGIPELRARIAGKRTALAGASGVGKSTISNWLAPDIQAETGHVSEKTKKGKHTTRHAELFDLGDGTMIFDTPGFSSFEILEADEEELQFLYPEIEPLVGSCKYDNCRHMKEPGCAVQTAVAQGRITSSRYDSYRAQLLEIQGKNRY